MAQMPNAFTGWDYFVFFSMPLVSMGIGVYFAIKGKQKNTQDEYLKGSKTLSVLPVAISILVSFQSGVAMLGNPAEMYNQGVEFALSIFGAAFGYLLSGLLFVPLIYPLGLTSSNQYLEMRFRSRSVRLMGVALMSYGQTLLVAMSSFAPATASQAVTGFPIWTTLLVTGFVATFYTTVGGMRAVIWTDVFQSGVMLAGMLSIIIQGVLKVGGLTRVFEITDQWNRLHFFTWDLDPRVRHTVWGLIIGQAIAWVGNSGPTQSAVQRYSSLPSLKKAKVSVLINIFGIILFMSFTCLCGIVMFAYYAGQNCDPLAQGLVEDPNQMIPYMVMDILAYPCIPGLFMSALFSGALSSISSALNGVAAVVWEDVLRPSYGHLPEARKTVILKAIVAIFGLGATCVSFILVNLEGTVVQITQQLGGPVSGTICGLFFLGGLIPFANKYGALAAGFSSITVCYWQSLGAFVQGITNQYLDLPSPNGSCGMDASSRTMGENTAVSSLYIMTSPAATNSSAEFIDVATTLAPDESESLEDFYKLSYLWLNLLAILTCLIVGSVISLLTRPLIAEDERHVPSKYQMSIVNGLCCCFPPSCRYYFNCSRTFDDTEDDEEIGAEKSTKKNSRFDEPMDASSTNDKHGNNETMDASSTNDKHGNIKTKHKRTGKDNQAFETEDGSIQMTHFTRI